MAVLASESTATADDPCNSAGPHPQAAVGPELAHLELSEQLEDVEERLQGFVQENLDVDSENFWQVLMVSLGFVRA